MVESPLLDVFDELILVEVGHHVVEGFESGVEEAAFVAQEVMLPLPLLGQGDLRGVFFEVHLLVRLEDSSDHEELLDGLEGDLLGASDLVDEVEHLHHNFPGFLVLNLDHGQDVIRQH